MFRSADRSLRGRARGLRRRRYQERRPAALLSDGRGHRSFDEFRVGHPDLLRPRAVQLLDCGHHARRQGLHVRVLFDRCRYRHGQHLEYGCPRPRYLQTDDRVSGRRRSLPFQGYFRGADGSRHARGDRGERADARDSLRRTGDLRGFGHGDAGGRVGVDSRLCAGAGGGRGVFRHFERRRRDAQRELLGRDHAGRLPPADPHHHLCRFTKIC